jgi:hypothetical protein
MKANSSHAAATVDVQIVVANDGPTLKAFIDLPWRLYAEYPNSR